MRWIKAMSLATLLSLTLLQSGCDGKKNVEKIVLEPQENIFNMEYMREQAKKTKELERIEAEKKAEEEKKKKETQLSKEVLLIARVVQAESLNQPYEGKVAVASVIMNRANRDIHNVPNVIYKKNAFSSVSRGNRLFNSNHINEDCIKAAIEVINGRDNVDGATNFVNHRDANPSWTKKLKKVKTIGDHTFYKYK